MKNKIFKIIALTLVILTIIYCPLNSFKQGKEVFASVTLTAAALKILSVVIPIVATYICYNMYGSTFTDSVFTQTINKLNTMQETIYKGLTLSAKLIILATINKSKEDIKKTIEELANELNITDTTIISNADTYSTSLANRSTIAGDLLKYDDIKGLCIDGALAMIYGKVYENNDLFNEIWFHGNSATFSDFGTGRYDVTNFRVLNRGLVQKLSQNFTTVKTTYGMQNNATVACSTTVITSFLNSIKYTITYTMTDNCYPVTKLVNLETTVYSADVSYDAFRQFVSTNYDIHSTTFDRNFYITVDKFYPTGGADRIVNYLDIGQELYNNDLIGFNNLVQNLSTFGTLTANDTLFVNNFKKVVNDYLTANPTSLLYDVLNLRTVGTMSIPSTWEGGSTITIPFLPTESICNDKVLNNTSAKDKEFVTPDVNVMPGETETDVKIGERTVGTETGVKEESPATPGNPAIPDNPDGKITDGTISWYLKIPVLGEILRALQELFNWLKSVLNFEWLKDLINTIISTIASVIEAIKNLPDSIKDNIDWGRFKGFFDIFIILIFLLLILCKIFIKLLGVVASLLTVEASSTFFNQYPTILAGVNYIKGIKVPGINVTLFTVITYMFTVFFIIYVLKIIQAIYHSFVKQEDNEIRNAEKNIKQNNRINRTNSDIASKFRNGGDNL